ncbi:response regulator transcription factor [Paenibacillus sacheonensis]|uniref:Helix-turn-helix domain-containing protein n=1 Tax=Paenibacillus sacheonensis TaxID=742054 RepID=A0A7X4YNP0_9BACL|nr:helix-turn-helix domain-containing protein [Paenibacillus sacheonensis]MBM7565359.1 two-component system response regulator YesN [Paenibacillus sacheonensis]NBC69712.1 helix-turn-helix domain-containing protein [Paenibacillus sacheonensis]
MYRLLITDDETIIVDGLFEMFSEYTESMELELYRAYSGDEAIKRLHTTQIDILLTDIHMPGISGLEVLRQAKSIWAHCKVIMLTGYNEFKYIQEAVRSGSIEYVLKTEGDAKIVQAVEKACLALKEEWQLNELIVKAKDSMSLALPMLRKAFLMEWLEGARTAAEIREEQLAEMQIPLRQGQPVLLVTGKVDQWRTGMSLADKELLLFAIDNIAEEYLRARLHVVQVKYESDQWVWLLQSRDPADDDSMERFVYGSLEMTQKQADQLLKLSVSFLIGSKETDWNKLPEAYYRMKWQISYGIGMGREMMLHEFGPSPSTIEQENDDEGPNRSQYFGPDLKKLESYLESGSEEAFRQHMAAFLDKLPDWNERHTFTVQEIFLALSSMFMTCMNRSGLTHSIGRRIDLGKCVELKSFADWKGVADYFLQIAAHYFLLRNQSEFSPYRDVIQTIETYVHAHIAEDLSLTRMAEIVYLNPYYLSRLYKKLSGITLTDYVIHVRMEKAKELLRGTNLKVNEIAQEIGFESPAYFTRFFKRVAKMTPIEYRER